MFIYLIIPSGKNVLDTKNELEKVMAKRKDEAKKKEFEAEKLSRRSSLERRLEEQQLKIKLQEECANQSPHTSASSSPEKQESEFLKIYSKVKCATNHDNNHNNNDDNHVQKGSTPMASKT
jgi:ribosomal protein L9